MLFLKIKKEADRIINNLIYFMKDLYKFLSNIEKITKINEELKYHLN